MLVRVDAPLGAAVATELTHTIDLLTLPSLHSLEFADPAGPGSRLRLCLSHGAHQVILDGPRGRLCETVGKVPGRSAALPAVAEHRIAGYHYRFQSQVELSARKVRDAARLYPEAWDSSEHTLLGMFEGDPAAIIMVRVELRGAPGRVRWSSWHTLPGSGEFVSMTTTLTEL